MTKSFPVRETSILSASELASRVCGLAFLAQFVHLFGLESSAVFRTALPIIGVSVCLGSIGFPQAITRFFAANHVTHARKKSNSITFSELRMVAVGTGASVLLSLTIMGIILLYGVQHPWPEGDLSRALEISTPLPLFMCISGSLRGLLLGLGFTYVPALSQVLETCTRLCSILWLGHHLNSSIFRNLSGVDAGIALLVLGELSSALLLATMAMSQLHVRREPRRPIMRDLAVIFRMASSPSIQAFVSSLFYAVELPLAQTLLEHHVSPSMAETWIGQYSAVAIPLLCSPMVFTDGMSTALLPTVSADKERLNPRIFGQFVRKVLSTIILTSLPLCVGLWILAPVLTSWFSAPGATDLLRLSVLFAFPLYLQGPLSALIQARGYSRVLFLAEIASDALSILMIYEFLGRANLGREGLVWAFGLSVLVQTMVLMAFLYRLGPFRFPWRTAWYAIHAACLTAALCLVATHVPNQWGVSTHPVLWGLVAAPCLVFQLLMAGEISPFALERIPFAGSLLATLGHLIVRRSEETTTLSGGKFDRLRTGRDVE